MADRLERRPPAWPDADALLIVAASGRDPDLARFVGDAHLGESFLLWPAGRQPLLGFLTAMERQEAESTGCRLLTPETLGVVRLLEEQPPGPRFWAAVLERAFDLSSLAPGTVAVAGSPPAGDLLEAAAVLGESGWRFVSGREAVRRLRKRKQEAEMAAARLAAAATVTAFEEIAALLAAGFRGDGEPLADDGGAITAGRLRQLAASVFARCGLDQPEGNIVACGADAGVPHTRGSDSTVLQSGRAVVVDLFPRGRLFADCTRTFCVGEAPADLRAAHAEVARALDAAQSGAVAGASGWDLQRATCELFAAAGHPTPISHPGTTRGYVHGLGHGVGYELHELPSFRRRAGEAGVLETGDLFTLEPGLYEPERGWGVRLENLCLLGESGVENLTPLPTELDPRRW